VTLLTCRYKGKEYGAGRCFLRLGGVSTPAVAVKAGAEKWLDVPEAALPWLLERGLPEKPACACCTGPVCLWP